MQLPASLLPSWPPLLATRGPGSLSSLHAHHAMHFVLTIGGRLRVRGSSSGRWTTASGVVTAPDAKHAIDAVGSEVLLVFLDPESDAGASLARIVTRSFRVLDDEEASALTRDADPQALMQAG